MNRLQYGINGEAVLHNILEESGDFIQVAPHGQGTMDRLTREAIRGKDVLLRWTPDILATHNSGEVIAYDAKTSSPKHKESENVTVEKNSVKAALAFSALVDSVYFVFDCRYMASPEHIKKHGILQNARPFNGGSGTPYYLISKEKLVPFSTLSRWFPTMKPLPGVKAR